MGRNDRKQNVFAASADIYLPLRADYGSERVRRDFRRCGRRINRFLQASVPTTGEQ